MVACQWQNPDKQYDPPVSETAVDVNVPILYL